MSGLITEHMLLACTIVFTAALCITGINLFLVLNTTIEGYREKYESAVVTHTGNNITTLTNMKKVSYPEIGKAIDSNTMVLNYVHVTDIDGVTHNIDCDEAPVWLKWKAAKFGTVEYKNESGKFHLYIQEVDG